MIDSKGFHADCKRLARDLVFYQDRYPPDSIERQTASQALKDLITTGTLATLIATPEAAYDFFVEDARHHPDRGYMEWLPDTRGVFFIRLPGLTVHRFGETLDPAMCTLPTCFEPLLAEADFRMALVRIIADAREGGFQSGMDVGRWQKVLENAEQQLAAVDTEATSTSSEVAKGIAKSPRRSKSKPTQLDFGFEALTAKSADHVQ